MHHPVYTPTGVPANLQVGQEVAGIRDPPTVTTADKTPWPRSADMRDKTALYMLTDISEGPSNIHRA